MEQQEQQHTEQKSTYIPQRFKETSPDHELPDASGYHAKRYKRKKRPQSPTPALQRQPQQGNRQNHPTPERTKRRRPAPEQTTAPQNRRKRPPRPGTAPRVYKQDHTKKATPRACSSGIPKKLWHLSLIGYIALLVIGIFVITGKVRRYMAHYEASQPKYAMDRYISTLSGDFYLDMLRETAAEIPVGTYETTEQLYQSLSEQIVPEGSFTYAETNTAAQEQPVYTIYKDGAAVADVTLDSSETDGEYGFPVWTVCETESRIRVTAQPEYTVRVTMPPNSALYLNGVAVPSDRFTAVDSDLQLDQTSLKYSPQPLSVQCEISGFYLPPDVKAVSAEGIELTPEIQPENQTAVLEYTFLPPDIGDADPLLRSRTEELTKAYINYVINKDRNREGNMAVMNQYLLPGGQVQSLMYGIWGDIFWNNRYNTREDRRLEILHIRKYTDTCCVCEVAFETVLSKVAVNDYTGTIRWTMIHNGNGWYASGMQLVS